MHPTRFVLLAALATLCPATALRAQGATLPAPSPDGQRLAFTSTRTGKQQIYVRNLVTGEERRISADTANDRHPAWSPDGRRLAFESDRDRSSIWIVDVETGEEARLTPTGTFAMNPAWSPDGRWVAVAAGAFPDLDLWLYPASGRGTPVRLTSGPAADYWPAFAPDGERIAFVQATLKPGERKLDTEKSGIAMVGIDGTGRRLVLVDTAGVAETPAFSPDGRWLAVQLRPEGRQDFDLVTIRPDGAPGQPLQSGPASEEAPVWSPPPTRLYYQRRMAPDTMWTIWTLDPATGEARQVVRH